MSYHNYDDWKLSNPDDDGHYIEDTDAIQDDVYFKHLHNRDRYWAYGMINKEGYQVTITRYISIPAIELDEMDATQTNQDDEINRIRAYSKGFVYIDRDEFMNEYRSAMKKINDIVL
jgi:hypothetical protein